MRTPSLSLYVALTALTIACNPSTDGSMARITPANDDLMSIMDGGSPADLMTSQPTIDLGGLCTGPYEPNTVRRCEGMAEGALCPFVTSCWRWSNCHTQKDGTKLCVPPETAVIGGCNACRSDLDCCSLSGTVKKCVNYSGGGVMMYATGKCLPEGYCAAATQDCPSGCTPAGCN